MLWMGPKARAATVQAWQEVYKEEYKVYGREMWILDSYQTDHVVWHGKVRSRERD